MSSDIAVFSEKDPFLTGLLFFFLIKPEKAIQTVIILLHRGFEYVKLFSVFKEKRRAPA
jgi:hypothetical protein